MPLMPTRRQLLGAAAAWTAFSGAPAAAPRRVLDQVALWRTENAELTPLANAGGVLCFSGDRTIGAVSLADGGVTWQRRHDFGGPARFRPRIVGSVAVCGGGDWLAAFDLADGREIWRYHAAIETGVPLVEAGQVLFADGHRLMCLSMADGRQLWQFAGIADTLGYYAPAATDQRVYWGPGDGRLYALNRQDGSLAWAVDGRERWQYLRQMSIEGGILVAGSYTELLTGLSLQDGHEIWAFNAGNFINSQLVADGTAYFWSPTGWIYAINAANGRRRWRRRTTRYDDGEDNWPSVLAELQTLDDHLYVLTMDSVVHRLDIETGEQHLAARSPETVRHAILPVAGQGLVFPTVRGDVLLTGFLP